MTVCIYFRFHQVLFRCVRIIEHVFCHAGVLVCLFVVTVADFWYNSLKIGYRILNCIMNLLFLIFWILYFAWGLLKVLSKSFLLQLFCLLIPIWYSFVSVVIVIGFLFVGMVQKTLRKLGRCQMTQLI